MDVVLIHPEIPWNTGNIGRTCVSAGARLHLVQPLGFELSDRWVKRAGLDYWQHLDVTQHASTRAWLQCNFIDQPMFLFSRFAKRSLWQARMPVNSALVFGSETTGLPKSLKAKFSKRLYRIPSYGPVRSLNLSTAVAIVLYEVLRQNGLRLPRPMTI